MFSFGTRNVLMERKNLKIVIKIAGSTATFYFNEHVVKPLLKVTDYLYMRAVLSFLKMIY